LELRDFIVTPIILFIIYMLAYWIRPKVTDVNTKRYFIPALTVKIIGALAVGFIYQFYYGGGDTFAYHTHGSRVIWEAFTEDPVVGLKLFLNEDITSSGIYEYASRIWYYNDTKSFTIIQIATFFDLFTFSSYAGTAILFAGFSFSGVWALYLTFYKKIKSAHLGLALAVLFVPTVFFWGSGILKDTITMGLLGWMAFTFDKILIENKISPGNALIFVFAAYLVYSIKIYILLSFLPAAFIWFYFSKIGEIRSQVLKIIIAPFMLFVIVTLGYFAVLKVGENDPRYSLDQIAETARITAYDIRFGWGARFGDGSGYYLGELDGSFGSMIKLAPAAVNVSLFRPYLWEVQNPLMLLSALESLFVLILTLWIITKVGFRNLFRFIKKPEVAFCLLFSLVFAFAVGISTYNFGTLSRYKIPMMPFYLSGLILLFHYSKSDKKLSSFDFIE